LESGPGDDGFRVEIRGGPIPYLVEYLAEMLGHKHRPEPLNYITMDVTHETLGRLVLTLHRASGKTPSERIGELEKALRECQDCFYDGHRHHDLPDRGELYKKIEELLKK
jgi:hypothetical protein